MKRYGLVFFVAAVLALSSCTREMQEPVRTGRFTISATADECEGKTTINGTVFKWEESDKIGLFVNQASMPVVNSPCSIVTINGDGKKADFATDSEISFDMTGKRYVSAYYPYKSSQNSTNLTFSIPRLQKQSDKDASHVGKYDYMAARQTELKGESADMNFSHLMTKVDFQFINEHEIPLTVKSVKIKTAEALFHTSANYDILETYPVIKAVESTAVDEIGVETEGEWTVVAPEEMLTATMMMIPADLSDKKVIVTVTTKEKGEFIFEKDGIDFLPENRYRVLLAIKEKTFIVEPSELDFGDTETEKSFFITSLNGMSEVNLACSSSWLTLSESSITVQADKTAEVKATIDRSLFVSGRRYSATINVTSGTTTRTVTAKASVSSENEAISPHDDLIISVDKCTVSNRIGTINFTIKNIGEVQHSIRMYTTYYIGIDEYAFAYDDRGNELVINTVNGCGSMNSSSFTIPSGEEKGCSLTIQNVSNDAAIMKCANLKCVVDNGKESDIFFNNVSIEDRSPSPLTPAMEGITMTCDDPDLKFEIYDIKQQYPNTIFYYRLTNTSDELINMWCFSPAMCFDRAGNEYLVSMGNLGFVDSSSHETRIPSRVTCNGTFTVSGLPRTYPKLEWLSFRTKKKFIYNRQESTEWYYSEMIMRDFEVVKGSETPELAQVTAKAPGYLYNPDRNMDFKVVSSRIDGDNLKVDFRLKDNDKCTKWFFISDSDCMAYAYDDRDNFYKLSSIKVGCEGTGADIAPEVWCNGSFILTGFDEKASKLKYLTFKTEYGDNYPSTKKEAFLIMKDLEVEGRTASSDPFPQVETTADAVSSFDDDLRVSVISCTATGSTVDFRFKIKNLSDSPKIIDTYKNSESFAFDDLGNSLGVSSILCGGYNPFAIPAGQECYVKVLIPKVKLEAGKLQIISINAQSYDENRNNSKYGRFDFKGVRIQEREPATPPEPTTTAASAYCSNNSDIEVKVLGCSLISDSKAKVSLMLHNKGSEPLNCYLFETEDDNDSKWSNAYDYHGRRFSLTDINIAGIGNTSVTLGPDCDCSLTFNLNGLVPETGLLQMVNVQGSIILRVTDLKIEGREDSPIVWPEPSTTFGAITSPYYDLTFEGVSAKVKDGALYVKYIVSNNSNDFRELPVYNQYNYSFSSYVIDNLGNYHRIDAGAGDYEKGYWYCNNFSSSAALDLGFAPNYKGYAFFRINNFDEKASSIRELSLQAGYEGGTRLVFKDIAIEGREPVALPESTTTCGEIVSCSDDLKLEMLGCKLADGHLQVTMKVTNTSSNAKFIAENGNATIVDSNGQSFSIGYGGISGNEYYYNRNHGVYIPSGIPVVLLFDGTGVYTEATTIAKLEEKFHIYTGFNREKYVSQTLIVNDIKIEGR